MAQDSFSIGIIGGGPAGCCCAYFLLKNGITPTIIDSSNLMRTILPTGGGKCNLAHAEYDYRELVKNYPRGEKFLYSIFSRFSTSDTIELFDELGLETYVRDDNRIFPTSNNSKDIQQHFQSALKECHFVKEKVLRIEQKESGFCVITDMNSYSFDKLVVAIGGKSDYNMIKRIGISIVEPKPALVGLVTRESTSELMGISIKDVYNHETGLEDDILFTHYGLSGPLIYKISSLKSRDNLPYSLSFDLAKQLDDLQTVLNSNPHKFIKNILSDYLPLSLCEFMLKKSGINPDEKCHRINGIQRDIILENIRNYTVQIKSTQKDGETVTSGGVDLDKINPKTMESKEVKGLYFCGEVIDVDGFCGGFNLQNCWSTGYVCANGIIS